MKLLSQFLKNLFVKSKQTIFFLLGKSSFYLTLFILLISIALFAFVIKGQKGNPIYYQTNRSTQVGGPFEASNSTSRFALTEAIVLNKSFILSKSLAEFASPDVVFYKGNFISIFTPGVPLIGVPFYIFGSYFSMPQLFTYLSTIIFALLNIFLIAKVATKLGSSYKVGLFAGTIFAFATNALVYSLTFTQHIFSVSIVLLALLVAFNSRNWKNAILFGILFGLGILIDIPNAFFLLPIGLYILATSIQINTLQQKRQLIINTSILGFIIGVIPLIVFFGWYNYQTAGSVTQLAQRIGRSDAFDKSAPPQLKAKEPSSAQAPSFQLNLHLTFQTRPQLVGMYTLLVSDERSWIYYCPIVFIGILGFFLLYKNKETRGKSLLIVSVILVDILIYSMFDDPWGGWAFGPRYLIPAAALLCLLIAPTLYRFKKNLLYLPVFGVLLYYSLWVSLLGALTTSSIPPKVEAVNLSTHIPYTYLYNIHLLQSGLIGSLFYNLYTPVEITPEMYLNYLLYAFFGFFCLQFLFLFDLKRLPYYFKPSSLLRNLNSMNLSIKSLFHIASQLKEKIDAIVQRYFKTYKRQLRKQGKVTKENEI